MWRIRVPVRSWLYTPGNVPRRMANAFMVGADAVVLDLEDSVPDAEKDSARRQVVAVIDTHAKLDAPAIFVRVNAVGPVADADVAAVVREGLAGIRVPKCERVADVIQIAERVTVAERARGLVEGGIAIVCGIETARGVWDALDIATASPRIYALSFGAADFARDLSLMPGPDAMETLHARSHLVIASRVAGIRPPIESVYTDIADLDGLARTTHAARNLGYFGRSVIHPTQVPVVNAAFTPDTLTIERAREIVAAAGRATAGGSGAFRLSSGEFIDSAIVHRAEDTIRLAAALKEGST